MPRIIVCSEFFCEPQLWMKLQNDYLPPLLSERSRLAAWSIGCYTGKEPFSLAILLHDMGRLESVRLLATDNDPAVLAAACRGGPFSERDVETIIPEERGRFFAGGAPPFFVKDHIRQAVEYRYSNVVVEPVPGRFHLVLYRNVEPFFDTVTNRGVCAKIYDALEPGGILFCSSVDRIPVSSDLDFEVLGPGFFRKPRQHNRRDG